MLQLKREDLELICAQARREYPAECCGVLSAGAGDGTSRFHACENIQERLHAEDPGQYPRDARTAYFIDPGELFGIISAAEKAGGRVTGFYHSHIDCDAYFSAEDKRRAMTFGDEPDYPEAVYLVLSVYGEDSGASERQVRGYKCFAWDSAEGDFAEVELQVAD